MASSYNLTPEQLRARARARMAVADPLHQVSGYSFLPPNTYDDLNPTAGPAEPVAPATSSYSDRPLSSRQQIADADEELAALQGKPSARPMGWLAGVAATAGGQAATGSPGVAGANAAYQSDRPPAQQPQPQPQQPARTQPEPAAAVAARGSDLHRLDRELLARAIAAPFGSPERARLAEQRRTVRAQIDDMKRAEAPVVDEGYALETRAKKAGYGNVQEYLNARRDALRQEGNKALGSRLAADRAERERLEQPFTEQDYAASGAAQGAPGDANFQAFAGKLNATGMLPGRMRALEEARQREAATRDRYTEALQERPEPVNVDNVMDSLGTRQSRASRAKMEAAQSVEANAPRMAEIQSDLELPEREARAAAQAKIAAYERQAKGEDVATIRAKTDEMRAMNELKTETRNMAAAVQNNNTEIIERNIPRLASQIGRTLGVFPSSQAKESVIEVFEMMRGMWPKLNPDQQARYARIILDQIGNVEPGWLDTTLSPGYSDYIKKSLDGLRMGTF